MANEYATIAELKSTLELTGETFADADLDLALTAASRGIDNAAGRRFWADADATSERFYSPEFWDYLRIDDLIEMGTLSSDPGGDGSFEEVWTENTDYVLEPLNAVSESEPFTTVRVHPNGSFHLPTAYPRSVRVVGQFGWEAVPEAIKEATVVLASKLLRRAREAPFGIVTIGLEAGSAMRIARMDPDVAFLLGPYIRGKVTVA